MSGADQIHMRRPVSSRTSQIIWLSTTTLSSARSAPITTASFLSTPHFYQATFERKTIDEGGDERYVRGERGGGGAGGDGRDHPRLQTARQQRRAKEGALSPSSFSYLPTPCAVLAGRMLLRCPDAAKRAVWRYETRGTDMRYGTTERADELFEPALDTAEPESADPPSNLLDPMASLAGTNGDFASSSNRARLSNGNLSDVSASPGAGAMTAWSRQDGVWCRGQSLCSVSADPWYACCRLGGISRGDQSGNCAVLAWLSSLVGCGCTCDQPGRIVVDHAKARTHLGHNCPEAGQTRADAAHARVALSGIEIDDPRPPSPVLKGPTAASQKNAKLGQQTPRLG
eukprot:1550603-Rhodomonas_salina.1